MTKRACRYVIELLRESEPPALFFNDEVIQFLAHEPGCASRPTNEAHASRRQPQCGVRLDGVSEP